MIDSFKHKGQRKKLVQELKDLGIKDESVLNAINTIPRHWFIEESFEAVAYENNPFPIGAGQTISNPYTVAYQTELLQLKKTDSILEIGTGSGYQASILSLLAKEVYTIERHKSLSNNAKHILDYLDLKNIQCFYGDGFEGQIQYAPFDKILITAAAPEIPSNLLQQLTIYGTMVLPLNNGEHQQMLRITKNNNLEFTKEYFENFTFVPMLKGIQ